MSLVPKLLCVHKRKTKAYMYMWAPQVENVRLDVLGHFEKKAIKVLL